VVSFKDSLIVYCIL